MTPTRFTFVIYPLALYGAAAVVAFAGFFR